MTLTPKALFQSLPVNWAASLPIVCPPKGPLCRRRRLAGASADCLLFVGAGLALPALAAGRRRARQAAPLLCCYRLCRNRLPAQRLGTARLSPTLPFGPEVHDGSAQAEGSSQKLGITNLVSPAARRNSAITNYGSLALRKRYPPQAAIANRASYSLKYRDA